MSASLLGDLQNPRNPTVYRVHTCRLRFRILPTHHNNFLMCSSSIGHMPRPIGHVDHRSAYERNMAFNCCCTCLHMPPGFLTSPPRAGEHRTLQPGAENYCWCHLTSPDDVIHVSSHASTSTSALIHVSGSTARPVTQPRNPEPTLTSIHWL